MAERQGLLASLLGANRYWRLVLFFHERPGVTIALAAVPVALLAGWLAWWAGQSAPVLLDRDGHVSAAVLFSEPQASDDGDFSVRFHVELPDGTRTAVRTTDLARAMNVIDTACLARLVDPDGAAQYRLAWPADCK